MGLAIAIASGLCLGGASGGSLPLPMTADTAVAGAFAVTGAMGLGVPMTSNVAVAGAFSATGAMGNGLPMAGATAVAKTICAAATMTENSPLTISPTNPSVQANKTQTFSSTGGSGTGLVYDVMTNTSGGSFASAVYTAGVTGNVVTCTDVVRVTDSLGNTATTNVTVSFNLPSLVYWGNSEAANIVLTSGKVSQMTDLSGNGNHAVQGTAGNRPVITSAALNGHDIVHFLNANTACLTIPYASSMQTVKVSIAATYAWNTATHGATFLGTIMAHQTASGWNDGWAVGNVGAGTDGITGGWVINYTTAGGAHVQTTYQNTTWRQLTMVYDKVNLVLYTDGSSVATAAKTIDISYSGNCQTVIGAYNNASGGTPSGFANIDLAEIFLCGDALSSDNIAALHARAHAIYATP